MTLYWTSLALLSALAVRFWRAEKKRERDARDLAEVERIIAGWAPKRHSYRRHGRFARKPYASFTVRNSFYEN